MSIREQPCTDPAIQSNKNCLFTTGKLHIFRLVLETLRQVNEEDPDRKCFRMVGGILVQKTVKDIYPQLQTNYKGVRHRF